MDSNVTVRLHMVLLMGKEVAQAIIFVFASLSTAKVISQRDRNLELVINYLLSTNSYKGLSVEDAP